MAYDVFSVFDKPLASDSLVNQSHGGYDVMSVFEPKEAPQRKTPATWGGEFSAAFGRGMDELGQMFYGAAALGSSWLGAEGMKDYFLEGYNAKTQLIQQNPETVEHASDIFTSDSLAEIFDKSIRLGIATAATFTPTVLQTVASSVIGGLAGTVIEPGVGTIAGGATGLVARKSVQKLLANKIESFLGESAVKELTEYTEGKIAQSALSAPVKAALTKQAAATAKDYGSRAAIGLMNSEIMTGALYGDLAQNPDIPESDKRVAATVGGLIASIPMTGMQSLIAKAFNPGVTEEYLASKVGQAVTAQEAGYVTRFLMTGGKELVKNVGEGGAAMFTQTAINLAAKNWADPNTRWDFLHYSPAQWQEMIDSTVKGAVGMGIIGAGMQTMAHMVNYPSPDVRSGMRDVLNRANDVKIEQPEVTPDHVELSQVQGRIGEIQHAINQGNFGEEDLTNLHGELATHQERQQELQRKLGLGEQPEEAAAEPLVNQKPAETSTPGAAPEGKKQASPLSPADLKSTDDLRAFYAQEMLRIRGTDELPHVPEEKVADKQSEVDTHISQIAGGTEYGKRLKEAFTPDLVRMMAAEDVHLTTDNSESNPIRYGANIDNHGRIFLHVPDSDFAAQDAERSGGDLNTARSDYLDNTHVVVAHEVAHVADLINLREQWKEQGGQGKLTDFVNEAYRRRGENFRKAEPSLPQDMFKAYKAQDTADIGALSDIQLGQELPRMAMEMARRGQTTEVTEALAKAARSDGPVNAFFRDWITSLKHIGETIRKWLNPETANPELLKAYDDINKTLDKYGVLVNEKPQSIGVPSDIGQNPQIIKGPERAFPVEEPPTLTPKSKSAPEPPPPIPEPLPSQQVAAEPKEKTPTLYQKFRADIKGKGPSDVVRSYLDWQHSKDNLPVTKAETDTAFQDFRNRAPNTAMTLDRFRNLVNERHQQIKENAKVSTEADRSEPAKKTSFSNEGELAAESDGKSTDLYGPDGGAARRRGEQVFSQLAQASKVAKPGQRLEAIRQAVIQHHPELLTHFDAMVQEAKSKQPDSYQVDELRKPSPPVKGVEAANKLQEYKYAMFVPTNELNEATRKIGEHYDIPIIGAGDPVPEEHAIIDLSGEAPEGDEEVSTTPPVTFTNKLEESRATDHIPETHALLDLGIDTITNDVVKEFNAEYGANGWIVKNFSDEARQGYGVFTASYIRRALEVNPDAFRDVDHSSLMVQRMYPTNISADDLYHNITRVRNNEMRVHITTNIDGEVSVIPFASFLKQPSLSDNFADVSQVTPVMFRDADLASAEGVARKAIESLSEEDRVGQFYGPDLIRTADGSWGVVELNPTDANGMSGWALSNPMFHSSYLASLLGEVPLHATLAEMAHEAVMADAEPLVNQSERSTTAEKPTFSRDIQKRLDTLEGVTQDEFSKEFYEANSIPKKARYRERGGLGEYGDAVTPESMEYKVQPKTEAMWRANNAISDEGGAVQMAERLMQNNFDPEITRKTAGPDEAGQPINAGLIAVYENSRKQLASMIGSGQLPRDVQTYLENLFHGLGVVRETLTALGRSTSMAHSVDAIINGATARTSYVEPFMRKLANVFGYKRGAQIFGPIRDALEGIKRDAMNRVITTPEMIAAFDKLSKQIFTREGQQAVRQTYVMTERDARRAVKKMTARAAEHVAMDSDNPSWAKEATSRLVKALSGVPAASDGTTEQRLFINAASQIAMEHGRDLGLVGEGKKAPTAEDKIASVLKNPGLYDQFTQLLRKRMVEEYKPEPGSPFAERMAEFHQSMQERSWSQGMVESLVNKNLKEFETTFAKIAKQHFGATDYNSDKMREAVKQAMLDRGVDNEGLVSKLMDDVEGDFRSKVEQARMDFMGSPVGVNKFLLDKAQGSLLELAKTHSKAVNERGEKLNEWLRQDYLIPDTPEMPLASMLHDVMTKQLADMIGDKRKAVIEDMLKRAIPNPAKRATALQQVDKVLQLVNLGVMGDQAAYEGLAKKFGLPTYSEETAQKMRDYGDAAATAPNEVIREDIKQEMSNFLLSQKGTLPYDMVKAMLYTNMLSGPSTFGVHVSSNFASTLGARVVDMVQHPKTIPQQLRQIFVSATSSALSEAQNTLITGNRLYRFGDKFYGENNPLEHSSVVFKSDLVNQRAAEFAEKGASLLHKVYRKLGAQYIGRYLSAADAFFYKINQEAAFTAKTGWVETPEARGTAMDMAREQMAQNYESPEDGYIARIKQARIANRILDTMRNESSPDAQEAMLSAHNEAMDATFKQKPKGILGSFANALENWANGSDKSPNLLGKMLVPFTRIAANVTNQMLEWTPFGLSRWAMGGDDFLLKAANGDVIGRDPKIAIRSLMGMGGMMALYGMAAQYHDDKDPWFAIYDDGSKNPEKRRQMMDMGWRPKTVKIGRGYYSYVTTPFAMAFSILGRIFDNTRDGRADENGLASSAVAMLQTVTHESFLSSLTNFMSAVDSPNPEAKISQMLAQMASTPLIPNLVKQIDKWVDPTIQQSQGFAETFLRQFPVVRRELKPSLNIFGQQLMHDPAINLPGMERFLTMEKTDDSVYNYLSESNVTVPGFSKSSRLGNQVMTRDQYYTYVEKAGPMMKQAIQAEIPQLRTIDREHAQERINEIVRKIKQQVRDQMRANP